MRKKITIIEDNEPIAEMYRFKLASEGYDVDVAHTGPAGLHVVKQRRPHLVLLDLQLPHMNGDEVLQHIRAQRWGKDIRVVIAANVSRTHAPKRLNWLHFDDYIVKAHFTPGQVLAIVQRLLQQAPDPRQITA